MRIVRILGIVFGFYVVLALLFDAAIGLLQPQPGGTAVLRTFDANGRSQDTVLGLLHDNQQLWVESGHWFKGWYHRVQANPNVQLIVDGKAAPYRAVPTDDPAAVDLVERLMGKGKGARYWVMRAMLLFAPIKPVRLDPLPPSVSVP
jgi:hypothetical protein